MSTRNEQKEQTRQKILWSALSLFVQKGYAATKISDIAAAVNMSTGLMFHHFESKEALYEELIRIGVTGAKQPEELQFQQPLDYFTNLLTSLLQYSREQPWVSHMFVLLETTRRSDAAPPHIRALASQVDQIGFSAEIIRKGQKMGTIRVGDAHNLAFTFWACVQGIMEQLAVDSQAPLPEAEWIMAILKKPGDD